jgi:hypothetical protein
MNTPIHSRPLSRQGRENHDRIFRRDRTARTPAPAITSKRDPAYAPMRYAGTSATLPIEEPDT